jgi:hypothetical protein
LGILQVVEDSGDERLVEGVGSAVNGSEGR